MDAIVFASSKIATVQFVFLMSPKRKRRRKKNSSLTTTDYIPLLRNLIYLRKSVSPPVFLRPASDKTTISTFPGYRFSRWIDLLTCVSSSENKHSRNQLHKTWNKRSNKASRLQADHNKIMLKKDLTCAPEMRLLWTYSTLSILRHTPHTHTHTPHTRSQRGVSGTSKLTHASSRTCYKMYITSQR